MLSDDDRDRFLTLMHKLEETYGKPESLPRARGFWSALTDFTMSEIEAAVDAHICDPQDGRWLPTPAHLIARIPRAATRPSPDEAWAIAMESFDESASVILTDEILEARSVAMPLHAAGDNIAARLAFVRAYERIAKHRHAQRIAPTWLPSLGHDAAGREHAITQAQASGLISADIAQRLLPSSKESGPIGDALTALPNLSACHDEKPAQHSGRLRQILAEALANAEQQDHERENQRIEERADAVRRYSATVCAAELLQAGEKKEARAILDAEQKILDPESETLLRENLPNLYL